MALSSRSFNKMWIYRVQGQEAKSFARGFLYIIVTSSQRNCLIISRYLRARRGSIHHRSNAMSHFDRGILFKVTIKYRLQYSNQNLSRTEAIFHYEQNPLLSDKYGQRFKLPVARLYVGHKIIAYAKTPCS